MMVDAVPLQVFNGRVSDATQMALIIAAYPFNMFFYFMFYTDTLSTLSLLVSYYLSMRFTPVLSLSASYFASHLCVLMVRCCNHGLSSFTYSADV